LFGVLSKGVVVVSTVAPWTGPWLGATRTASLQRVANRPIVCHVLDALRDAGVGEVAVLTPQEAAEEVAACVAVEGPAGVEVHHLAQRPGDEGAALLRAAELLGEEPCVLHRADGLLGQPLAPFAPSLREEAADALLLVQDAAREVRRLRVVPQQLATTNGAGSAVAPAGVAGVCLLAPGALQRLASAEPSPEAQLDPAALARRLARAGGRVHGHAVHRWRHFAGDANDLLDLNRTALEALDCELLPGGADDNRFEGPIAIHPTACVTSSVIIGPVVIGADALIADSYIGPHTSIAERVRIEGAELERSIVLADASVLHVGGRLVASVVGRGARVFRDFSVPRALRLQVGDGDEVALC
jgi:glucose-1-phosphate thymidylyltransferase